MYENAHCCHAGYFMRRSPFEEWKDYIRLAIECEYDLSQEVVFFPKDLLSAHDEVTELYNRVQAERKAAELASKKNEALKRLAGRRKKEGALTILFMRRVSDPEKNFITIEMSNKDIIVQARMFKNIPPDEDAQAFINEYKEILKERKKKRGKHSEGISQRGGCESA